MKKLLFVLMLCLGPVFAWVQPQPRPDTTIAGKTYRIQTGPRGGRYIVVISRTGTQYKRYLTQKPVKQLPKP